MIPISAATPTRGTRRLRPAPLLALAACILTTLALGACAPRLELPSYDLPGDTMQAFRQRFTEPELPAHGLAARASLLYSTPTKGNRTDVQLYGEYARPLRLDVRAGLGTMLALMREDSAGLLAFYPDNKKAYAHSDPVIGAQLLGLPFPFSLRDLALVLSGHFETLVPQKADNIRALSDGGFAFGYNEGPVRLLVLDRYGRPQRMEGMLSKYFKTQAEREAKTPVVSTEPRVWSLTFSAWPEEDGDPVGPAQTLSLDLPGGDSAVLRVRAVTPRVEAWNEKALSLPLPAGSSFMSLESHAAPAKVGEIITGGPNAEGADADNHGDTSGRNGAAPASGN